MRNSQIETLILNFYHVELRFSSNFYKSIPIDYHCCTFCFYFEVNEASSFLRYILSCFSKLSTTENEEWKLTPTTKECIASSRQEQQHQLKENIETQTGNPGRHRDDIWRNSTHSNAFNFKAGLLEGFDNWNWKRNRLHKKRCYISDEHGRWSS